jgi:MSHA biogenesis protein MshJ
MSQTSIITDKLHSLQVSIDTMSIRERLLVFATVVLLLTMLWYLFLMQPLAQQAATKRTEMEQIQARMETSNNSFEDQILQISGSGTAYQERLAQMQERIDEINARLGDYAAELINPAEMSQVLQGVLKEQPKLRLIRIRNLNPESLSASADAKTATFYKHGLEIEFEGSYFAGLEYLQQIETLPWRFYWQILELEVLEYPKNRFRLEVSTLSLDEEWIGG